MGEIARSSDPKVFNLDFQVKNDYSKIPPKSPIVVTLYVIVGDTAFPEDTWFDFIPVLGWWLRAIRDLKNGIQKEATLQFMDGPQAINLAYFKNNYARISLLRYDEDQTAEYLGSNTILIDIDSSERNLIRASQKAVADAESIGAGDDRDIEDIRQELTKTLARSRITN